MGLIALSGPLCQTMWLCLYKQALTPQPHPLSHPLTWVQSPRRQNPAYAKKPIWTQTVFTIFRALRQISWKRKKTTKHISIVDGLAHLFSIHVLSNPSSLAFAATWTENSLSASTIKMKNRNHNWLSSSSFATLTNMQAWWLCKRFSA